MTQPSTSSTFSHEQHQSLLHLESQSHTPNAPPKIKTYRYLAIVSIICGITCIGIKALINSVKAEEWRARDANKALSHSRQTKKYGITAIVVWVAILLSVPLLMGLLSYLVTFID